MRTNIMTTSNASITPDPMVMDYTIRNGRREGLLYNNRIHTFSRGDGTIEMKEREQYSVNREWILSNFK